MRYSVLGYNQELAIQYGLDLTDLMLLNYIQTACGSTTMKHKLDDIGQSYVWISHSKLQEDLPILNIAEGTLKNKLSVLKREGFIQSIQVSNEESRGSKTYYGITAKTESMLYTNVENTTTSFTSDVVERPRHSGVTSYSKLKNNSKLEGISNNKLLDITEGVISENNKSKKKNLYQKCIDEIMQYTNNIVLQEKLKEYLTLRLDIARTEGRQFYQNMWKGLLNDLDQLTPDTNTAIQIVEQSIRKGWKGFYALKDYSNSNIKSQPTEKGVSSLKETEEEYNARMASAEERKKKGEQYVF